MVYSLRSRMIAAFLVATALPLAATIWIATSLLDQSLAYSSTAELGRLTESLERAVRQFYQSQREALREDAMAGRLVPERIDEVGPSASEAIRSFSDSDESERTGLAGPGGNQIEFMRKVPSGIEIYRRDLGGMRLQDLAAEFGRARESAAAATSRDLRRGFTLTFYLLIAGVWLISLAPLLFIANRVTRPIRELTDGLTAFAAGDWDRRVEVGRIDEVGRAIEAFNRLATDLRASRDRVVYLAQMSSWQSLARKAAHEIKNSLTPIRLTVEEILARQPAHDRVFLEQAAGIVVAEIESLQARVRAFSEFADEPPLAPAGFDVNALLAERVTLLRPAHPDTTYRLELADPAPQAYATPDLVRSILTNLLENAADAAGAEGVVLARTHAGPDRVLIEIHDSGPGLSDDARRTLFEPTITFKKHGMGLGLSIARKQALLSGGDLELVPGALQGAAFRVILPAVRA